MTPTQTHLVDAVRLALTGIVAFVGAANVVVSIRIRDRVGVWAGVWCLAAAAPLCVRSWQHLGADAEHGPLIARLMLMGMLVMLPLSVCAARALVAAPPSPRWHVAMLAAVAVIAAVGVTDLFVEPVPVRRVDALGNAFWTARLTPATTVLIAAVAVGAGYALRLVARGIISSVQLGDVGVAAMGLAFAYAGVRRTSHHFHVLEAGGAMHARFIEKAIEAQERERRRIARDLHDTTGQALTSLLVRLGSLDAAVRDDAARAQLGELRELTRTALDEVRRTARGLHPAALEDLGFEAAVRAMAAEVGRARDMTIDVHLNGFATGERLPAALELALYRIAQEALTNAARHSEAKTVSILVDRTPERVRLIIEDDGIGIRRDDSTGLGLLGMRERAAMFGGAVTVESSAGAGTSVYVTIPTRA